MDDTVDLDIEISDEVGRFAETYSSFNKIINRLKRQYLTLKETYERQSHELQTVNGSLQSAIKENRAVTEFLDSILNSLDSGVITVDRHGIISHLNPAAEIILGLAEDHDRKTGPKYDQIMNSIENGEMSAIKAIELGTGLPSGEKKIITSYGKILTLSVSISLLMNRSGGIVGAVELFQDISKLKAMEEQLSQMKILASMGEMAAIIAHEIRNPLVGVGGFASLLARDLSDDPEKKEMAQRIMEGVDCINSIIRTLLDFARKEKIDKVRVDLNSYLTISIEEIIKEICIEGVKKRIRLDLPSKITIPVDLDRQLFKRAVLNLIKNGLELKNKNGPVSITVSTRLIPIEQAHAEYGDRIELAGTEKIAEIVIADNGPGLEKDTLENLFSPFYTTKEEGVGLGLSIAWKIVKAHSGDITAESTIGEGTKFVIILPVRE